MNLAQFSALKTHILLLTLTVSLYYAPYLVNKISNIKVTFSPLFSQNKMDQDYPKIMFYDLDHILPSPTLLNAPLRAPLASDGTTRSWSPATVASLLALRHRRVPYKRVAVSYPDIAPLLASKGVPPIDARVKYTLPAIDLIYSDAKGDADTKTIMDSQAIALALESLLPVSPTHPSLFPAPFGHQGEWTTPNIQAQMDHVETKGIDNAISKVGKFVYPFVPAFLDPRGREYFYKTREERFKRSLAEVAAEGVAEAKEKYGGNDEDAKAKAFEEAVGCIVQIYIGELKQVGGEKDGSGGEGGKGVFYGGRAEPSYPDLMIVACLEWWRCAAGHDVVDNAMRDVEGGLLMEVFKGCEALLYGY